MSRNARLALIPGVLLIALAMLTLSGCGQKGPLYMPGDTESSKTYDPQGVYDDSAQQSGSVKQTPGQDGAATQDRNAASPQSSPTSPQSSPAPAATRPNAEELP